MADREPSETTNLDIYGHAALLGTVDPDGRPHAAGVGALYIDGDVFIVSGPGTRKSRNLARNPASSISVSLNGIDLVLEGEYLYRLTYRTVVGVAGAEPLGATRWRFSD